MKQSRIAAPHRPKSGTPGSWIVEMGGGGGGGGAGGGLIVDTHAHRLASYPAASYSVGQQFFESDRTVTYLVESISGTKTWVAPTGVNYGTAFPTGLGAADSGLLFINTSTDLLYYWSGTAWVLVGGGTTGGGGFAWGGDGTDGPLNYDGTSTVLGVVPSSGVYLLTRDIFATTISVAGGATIKTQNYTSTPRCR